jgi:hypothetical protein
MNEVQGIRSGGLRDLWAKSWIRFLLYMALSVTAGYVYGRWLGRSDALVGYERMLKAAFDGDAGWALVGWAMLALFAIVGVVSLIASLRDRWVRQIMNMETREAPGRPRQMLRIGAVGMFAYVLVLALLLVPGVRPLVGALVGVAAVGLIAIVFLWGMRIADELQRAAQNEALAWSFIVVEAVLVGWALLNHFGYVGPLKALPLVLLLELVYLSALVVASRRRGLDQ